MANTTEPRLTDEAMMSLEEMVTDLVEPVEDIVDDENGVLMGISSISIDMPMQLDVVTDENGQVHLGTTPPLYHLETSFMPVFHQLRFTFEAIEK